MVTVDAGWFRNFDGIVKEIDTELHDIEDRIATGKAALEKAREELQKETTVREKNDAFIKEQVDRIELVSQHWFFGSTALQPQLWMRGGTTGKISRAQAKLDAAKENHPALQEAERVVRDEKVPAAEAEDKRLVALGERKARLEKERDELRAAAIAAHPSEAMRALLEQMSEAETTVNATSEGAEGLKKGGALCYKAVFHYTKAVTGAREAQAAEREAEAVVGSYAARHAPNEFKGEPAEAAAQREAMRKAATGEMAARAETLRTTISETSSGADALKSLVAACAKAKGGYESAVKLTKEGNDADRDCEALMHPSEGEPKYGAPPPMKAVPYPSGWDSMPPGEFADTCAREAEAEAAAERQECLDHLKEQQTLLVATIKETTEGAAALKRAAELCHAARTVFDRAMVCTKYAPHAASHHTRPCTTRGLAPQSFTAWPHPIPLPPRL